MGPLGFYNLCLKTADLEGSVAFYERLGFARTGEDAPGLRVSVGNGTDVLTFMTFLDTDVINFRGAHVGTHLPTEPRGDAVLRDAGEGCCQAIAGTGGRGRFRRISVRRSAQSGSPGGCTAEAVPREQAEDRGDQLRDTSTPTGRVIHCVPGPASHVPASLGLEY